MSNDDVLYDRASKLMRLKPASNVTIEWCIWFIKEWEAAVKALKGDKNEN